MTEPNEHVSTRELEALLTKLSEPELVSAGETPVKKYHCFRVIYSLVKVGDPVGRDLPGSWVRSTTDHQRFVVSETELQAGEAVLASHPDVSEVHVQQVAAFAKDVLLAL